MRQIYLQIVLLLGVAGLASAQTTGSVFGPEVDPDGREFEYRLGVEFDDAGGDASLSHRLHYQQALTDQLRWRALISWDDPVNGNLELDHIQGELLWQIIDRTPSGFSSGLRFDGRISEGDDVPHEIGVNWTNQWVLNDQWRVRALLLLDRDVGPQSNDDWIVETRASVRRSFENGLTFSVESFNQFGGLDAGFGSFDDQAHQIGPVLGGDLGDHLEWSAGVLIGISDGAPEQDFIFRLTRPLG